MPEVMGKKNKVVNVCTFMCGLFIGGAFVYFVNAMKTTGFMETTESQEKDYPQVYGVDLSFWQGNIQVDINMFNGTQDELRDYIQEKGIKRREGGVYTFLRMKI